MSVHPTEAAQLINSPSNARAVLNERDKAEAKLARIKDNEVGMSERLIAGATALGVGGLVGFLNAKEGGTAEAPAQLGGKLPLDTAVAGVGIAAAFMVRSRKWMPAAIGAFGAGLGLWGQRLAYNWQLQRMQAQGVTGAPSGAFSAPASSSSTPSSSSSSMTAGMVGYRGAMAGRLFGPGEYEENEYVRQYAQAAGYY